MLTVSVTGDNRGGDDHRNGSGIGDARLLGDGLNWVCSSSRVAGLNVDWWSGWLVLFCWFPCFVL